MVLDTFLLYFDDLWFITRIVRDKFVLTESKIIIAKTNRFVFAIYGEFRGSQVLQFFG